MEQLPRGSRRTLCPSASFASLCTLIAPLCTLRPSAPSASLCTLTARSLHAHCTLTAPSLHPLQTRGGAVDQGFSGAQLHALPRRAFPNPYPTPTPSPTPTPTPSPTPTPNQAHLCFDWKVFGFHKQQVLEPIPNP